MIEILSSIDDQILLFFNGNHTAFLDSFMSLITGKWIWIPFYLLLVDMIFRKLGPKYALMVLLSVVLAIVMTDQICASVIRPYIGRLRPCNPDNPIYQYITIVNGISPGGYSWPSCHAANTFALATLLSLVFRIRVFTLGIFAWAVMVSVSRLYLGVHYPTDILCGAAFGSVFGYLSLQIVTRLYIAIPRLYMMIRRRPDVLS
ncbi:MAG: phosphatase PAP2 family protein [Muribaculaceae bacterium]|nr:phosphatase PAP2 family protein [Muribaculaceae bacterium]